ncbi:MAG: LCP family protein [Acutalibacter sp.]|jgi:LCP family protein required for cell wall assembly
MGKNEYENGPRHGAPRGSRGNSRTSGSSASRSRSGSRTRREPLRDNYYYEEPAHGWKEGDSFQDISSYSSPAKRKADQRAMEEERRAYSRNTRQGSRGNSSQDIYSSSRQRPVKKKGSPVKKVLVVLLVLVLVVAGSMVYSLSGLTMTSITNDPAALGIQSSAMSDPQIVNIALFGLDSREDSDSGRSDVIMVLSVDKRHHNLKLTSILRDSEVAIEDYGYDKITHAYAYGGPELAIKTLNQNFNLDIKNYVTVNFYQMAEIVDAFGGVDLDLTADEVYQLNENLWNLSQESPGKIISADFIPNVNGEIDLINGPYQDGSYHLNGNQAVAYARIRHIDSDNVRASRQQRVLEALLQSLKKKNIFQYPGLIRKVSTMCETSMNVGDMLKLMPILFGGLNLETLSIPGDEEQASGATLDSGAWVYEYDLTAASQHINRFIYEEKSPYYTGE